MRAKRASQLQGEPRGPRAAMGVRGASEARSAAKPREHWTGPPEVMEGPGADGPFRAGAGSAVVVRMLGGDRAGVVPYTHVVHAVKTERKLWSSAWQLPLCVARSHTTGLCAPPMGRVGRTFGWGAAVGPGSWCSTHAPRAWTTTSPRSRGPSPACSRSRCSRPCRPRPPGRRWACRSRRRPGRRCAARRPRRWRERGW